MKKGRHTEKPYHKRAFEVWARHDGIASMRVWLLVGKEIGYSPTSIKSWYGWYSWRDRYNKRIEKALATEEKITDKIMLKKRTDYRLLISRGVDKFAENLKKGKVKMTTVADFTALAKLDLAMQGESPDGTTINVVTAIPRPDSSPTAVIPDASVQVIKDLQRQLPPAGDDKDRSSDSSNES